MSPATRDLAAAVTAAVAGVEDPEMSPLTIGQLGMILEVDVHDRTAQVALVPTFSGCPAIAYIGADVAAAVLAVPGIDDVDVRWRRDVAWGPERISDEGRRVLREVGIAPPGSGQQLLPVGGVRCPHCGSRNTRADSPFGSAPCRSTHSCRDCKTPFDAIKAV